MIATEKQVEALIADCSQAADGNLRAPGRQGNLVSLTPELAGEVMVTGDLHGHRRNFNRIVKLADLARQPRRHLVLQEVCHGGPVYRANGGCKSHAMLEDVVRLIIGYPGRVHFLLSNHELAEMTDYPIQKNKQLLNLMFRLGLQAVYGPEAHRVREAYIEFLETCPMGVRLASGVFISHSIPEAVDRRGFDTDVFHRPMDPSDYAVDSALFDLVWGRDYRLENAEAFARLVEANVLLNGHEPCREGFDSPNARQVILDCCGERAAYAILPTEGSLSQADVVEKIEQLR
jgi:hypothetical protein